MYCTHQLMLASEEVANDSNYLSKLLANPILKGYRSSCIEEIIELASVLDMDPDISNTSCQILDSFLSKMVDIDFDLECFELLAIGCIILGLKYDNTFSKPTLTKLPQFRLLAWQNLMILERSILCTINFNVFPQATPANFVHHFLNDYENAFIRSIVINSAFHLIAGFSCDPEYVLYAPSTIALASILLSFRCAAVDCTDWLDSVPDICLPSHCPYFQRFSPEEQQRLLDIDACLQHFELAICRSNEVKVKRPLRGATVSPTSVAGGRGGALSPFSFPSIASI